MIRRPKTEEQALTELAALCSRGEHCRQEMQEKLQRWGIMEGAQSRILDYLERERYIDEERFCRAFIREKMEYNGWGRRKIEQALWLKRISKGVSAPLFEEIPTEKWVERLRPLIQSKRRQVKGDSDYEINQKLMRFALGRGFSFDEIRKSLGNDCDLEPTDEEEWELTDE